LYRSNAHGPWFRIETAANASPSLASHARDSSCDSRAFLIGGAGAQSFGSSYTSTAEKDCYITNTGRDSSVSVCPGKAGLIVLVTEDDLRQTVSVGQSRRPRTNRPQAQASAPSTQPTRRSNGAPQTASRSRSSSAG
jgi:hypothetical protein